MNRREAEELLPWFVAGALNAEESQAVQAFVESGEISGSELESIALLAQTVAETGAEEPAYDPLVLTRAMAKLHDVAQDSVEPPLLVREPNADEVGEKTGWLHRLIEQFQWSSTPAFAKLAIGGQFALLLSLLVTVVYVAEQPPSTGEYGTVSGSVSRDVSRVDVSIAFTPGISEADIRALLLAHQASIVGGPSAAGIYTIGFAASDDVASTVRALRDSPLTSYVELVAQP